jgi:acetylornithine deacetylase/succinyl-diaminopimelate desuccinylase-like protein
MGAGPSIGNVHRPNEYTRMSELAQARDLYQATIEALCMREGD